MSDIPESSDFEEIPDIVPDEFGTFLGDIRPSEDPLQGSNTDQLPLDNLGFDEEPDVSPDPFEGATIPIGDGACVVCGTPTFRPAGLTKAGYKKRVPKYCDLHSPNNRISHQRSGAPGVESQLQRVQEELADDLRLLATLAGPLLPVTSYYVFDHADPFTIALLKLAKNNQRVLRVLHRAAQVAPIYTVAETVAGTAFAIQVDQHKTDPHSTVARRLGVEKAYLSVYPNEASEDSLSVSNNGFSKPPRYATLH